MSGHTKNENERNGKTEAELLDKSRNLALDGLVEMLAQIHRAKQAREDVRERGGGGGRASSDAGVPRVEVERRETAGDFLFDLAKTQLDIIDKLLKFQRKHADYLVERMRDKSAVPRGDGGDGSLLVVRGHLVVVKDTRDGENKYEFVITEPPRFVVENRNSTDVSVALRISELRSRNGDAPFFPKEVKFSTDVPFKLLADQEREVRITAIEAPFKANCRYRGHIEIACSGKPTRRLPLRIDVVEE